MLLRGTERRLVLLLGACLVVFCLTAEPAVRISNAQGFCWSPRIAIDSAGNIHVIWLEAYSDSSGDLFYSRRPAGSQTWNSPINLSNSGRVASESKMVCGSGLDGSQRLYAVWGEVDVGIRMRILTVDSWSGAETVSSFRNPDMARVAVDGSGNLFFIWYSYWDGEVWSRARVGGSWEETKLISDSRYRSKFPDIAVGKGMVYAVFTERTADYQTMYCRRGAGFNAAWTAPAPVYTEFPLAHAHPSVAVDSGGTAHIALDHVEPSEINSVAYTWWTGSGFAAPINLTDWTITHWPFITEKNNTVHVLWQEGSADWGELYFRSGQRSSWSGTSYVPDSNGAVHMDLDIDPQGQLGFVWSAEGEIYFGTATPDGGGGGGGGGGGTTPPPKPNQPPVANFNFMPQTGFAPKEIEFDGTASYDPDGMVVQWNWLFGDGGSDSGGHVFHTFQTQGIFQVKLTVIDNLGLTASIIKPIEILGILPPLNVRWQTFVDQSVFMTRYVTEVTWERNPENDRYNIVQHNIYRKNNEEGGAWKYIGRTTADVFNYRDTDVKQKDVYAYSVAVVDAQGHESRIGAQGEGSSSARTSLGRNEAPAPPGPGSGRIKKD